MYGIPAAHGREVSETMISGRRNRWLFFPVVVALLLCMTLGAQAAEPTCTARLPVEIQLNGDSTEQFTVTIEGEAGAPMPEQTQLQISGGSTSAFEGLTYTEPGDYVYTVHQIKGTTQYMTYDDTVYTVVIQVTNDGQGGLTEQIFASGDDNPDSKAASVEFLNTYAPPATTTSGQSAPKTGDTADLVAPVTALGGAALALVLLAALRRRGDQEDNQRI